MATKQEPKVNTNSPEWRAGYVDGYCAELVEPMLQKALGRLPSKSETAAAAKKLQAVTLGEIARRVLAAKGMPAGVARFNAIAGK